MVLTSTHNLSFEQKHEKYQIFFFILFFFFFFFFFFVVVVVVLKFTIYLNRRVFVMTRFSSFLHMIVSVSYLILPGFTASLDGPGIKNKIHPPTSFFFYNLNRNLRINFLWPKSSTNKPCLELDL